MPAELGLHRLGNLPLLEREGGIGERLHHFAAHEVAEIAALRRGRADRMLLGDFGEIIAGLEGLYDFLRLFLGRDKDVPGVHLQIGSASCRDRVCQYVSFSVAAVSLKKQSTPNTYR